MPKKILLSKAGQEFIHKLDDCSGFSLPSDQIQIQFENVTKDQLKAKVSNNLDFLCPDNRGLSTAFGFIIVNRQHLEVLLDKNKDTKSFRVYFGSQTKAHSQDDVALIVVPIDDDRMDILKEETCVIECEKPPGCKSSFGASLIEQSTLDRMFSLAVPIPPGFA
jgi:2-polyprenyl-6-methoxyphenol hydroxylase-like FAD-dependent oxidoreductase